MPHCLPADHNPTFNSRLASLRTKVLVSVLFIIFTIFAVAYRFFVPERLGGSAKTAVSSAGSNRDFSKGRLALIFPYMFSSPIFVFSYEVQSNVMAVIKDLHNRTGCKVLVSTSLALCVMSVFCIVLGILRSLTFPHLSSGNSFSSYSVETGVLRMACLLTCCFNAAMSYVFCISPCCRAAFMFLSRGNGTNISKKMCARLGAVLSSVCCILAIFLLDVAQVVLLLGAIFSSTLCMTFPALFAMQMRRFGTCLTPWVDALLPWVLLLKGLLFSATGTYMAFAFSSAGGT
ncbi:putative Transmembrane amino acid transporter protein [Leishmania utingensis]|uniref:Transmembrane amino acid transporter protein n=1 Tax=Leishmania utingensis TaxID=653362 RepID=A0AAW2ZVF5_9TRYP